MARFHDGFSAGKRLLILDDEEAILIPVARYLTDRGFAVVTAREPEEAEALLECQRFDLVILDLGLTRFGRDGLDVLGGLRAQLPWLPVIVLSANICPEVEDEARRLRADAVLSKPQPLAELARAAATALGARA
ncbi:MAG TPA: response regulator [Vicinamibacteria bacterium]